MTDSEVEKPRTCSHTRAALASIAEQWFARRPLARLLSTLLCSIIIVIRPFSQLGGQYAFLVLALKELVFSVQGNLAQQLELICLNILGALLGIGISTLAKYLASLAGHDTAGARVICAVFLILISFIGRLNSPLDCRLMACIIEDSSLKLKFRSSRSGEEQTCSAAVVHPDLMLHIRLDPDQ